MAKMRKPQDAVVSNVKRLRAEVRMLTKRVQKLEPLVRRADLLALSNHAQLKELRDRR